MYTNPYQDYSMCNKVYVYIKILIHKFSKFILFYTCKCMYKN
jgi:hypothetical protein